MRTSAKTLLALGIAFSAGVAGMTTALAAGDACHATTFWTQDILDACTGPNGSQLAAKEAMKQFMKDKKSQLPGLDCSTCHTRLAPDYPQTGDARSQYARLGGRLLASPVSAPAPAPTSVPIPAGNVPTLTPRTQIIHGQTIGAPPTGH